ncbi:uncharacterized protein LOC127587184 [Pristis pectinata]|uniref:uncharacterized protein LOC127587184 n=1 Tax=Pristis pectinata TaxID=685728 RepID=UPI00223DBA37|nr:uncharacterized protein LOC127587184 [Pristis pectinata]
MKSCAARSSLSARKMKSFICVIGLLLIFIHTGTSQNEDKKEETQVVFTNGSSLILLPCSKIKSKEDIWKFKHVSKANKTLICTISEINKQCNSSQFSKIEVVDCDDLKNGNYSLQFTEGNEDAGVYYSTEVPSKNQTKAINHPSSYDSSTTPVTHRSTASASNHSSPASLIVSVLLGTLGIMLVIVLIGFFIRNKCVSTDSVTIQAEAGVEVEAEAGSEAEEEAEDNQVAYATINLNAVTETQTRATPSAENTIYAEVKASQL